MLNNKWRKTVITVLISVILLGGASLVIIKKVDHLRIEHLKRQKAESIMESRKEVIHQAKAKQEIALWLVQHLEGPEPIRTIEIGQIEHAGIGGTGGSAVSVRINQKDKNIMNLDLLEDDTPSGGYSSSEANEFDSVKESNNKTLAGVEVKVWRLDDE